MQTDILFIIFFQNIDDTSQHRVTYTGYTLSVEFWDGPYYCLQCFSCALFGISGARRPGGTCPSISYCMCLVCFPLINDIAWGLEGGREQKPWYLVAGGTWASADVRFCSRNAFWERFQNHPPSCFRQRWPFDIGFLEFLTRLKLVESEKAGQLSLRASVGLLWCWFLQPLLRYYWHQILGNKPFPA